MLTYRTTDPDPQYLQVYVLSNLSSQHLDPDAHRGPATARREAARHAGAEPGHPDLAREHQDHPGQGLTTGAAEASFLPLPYPARTVSVAGDWRDRPAHAHHVLRAGPVRAAATR